MPDNRNKIITADTTNCTVNGDSLEIALPAGYYDDSSSITVSKQMITDSMGVVLDASKLKKITTNTKSITTYGGTYTLTLPDNISPNNILIYKASGNVGANKAGEFDGKLTCTLTVSGTEVWQSIIRTYGNTDATYRTTHTNGTNYTGAINNASEGTTLKLVATTTNTNNAYFNGTLTYTLIEW